MQLVSLALRRIEDHWMYLRGSVLTTDLLAEEAKSVV